MTRFYARPSFCYLIGFVIPYLLTFVPFVSPVGNYTPRTHLLIIGAMLAFYAGLMTVGAIPRLRTVKIDPPGARQLVVSNLTVIRLLVIWWLLGMGCLAFELAQIGGVPIFMADFEKIRFSIQTIGAVHLVSISTGTVSAIMFYFTRYPIVGIDKRYFLAMSLTGFALLIMTGNRSDSGFPIISLILALIFTSEATFKWKYMLYSSGVFFAFIAIKFIREASTGFNYVGAIRSHLMVEANTLTVTIYPLYMALCYNFTILDRLVRRGAEGVSGGMYTFFGIYSLLPGKQYDFGEFKNDIMGLRFYAELTSTYLSNFFVDFGTLGTWIGSFLMAIYISLVYKLALHDRRYILLYAFVFFHFMMFFYFFVYYLLGALINVILVAFFCTFAFTRQSRTGAAGTPDHFRWRLT